MTTITSHRPTRSSAAADSHHVLDVEPETASAVEALALECARSFSGPEDLDFERAVGDVAEETPLSLRRGLRRFRTAVGVETLVVRGLVRDHRGLEPTPPSWREARELGRRHAYVAAITASVLGECIGWTSQQDGRLVTDIVPTRGMEQTMVSSSSALELGWHTEDAFSDFRADYVGLLGLRDTAAAATTVASLAVEEMPDGVGQVLSQPRFVTRPDDAHERGADEGLRATAVLSGHPETPVLRVDRDFTTVHDDADDEAHRALQWIRDHLDDRLVDVPIRPGDMAFLDNRRVVHGRRSFVPRYDGADRWLKRVNVVVDLSRTDAGRHSLTRRIIG